MSRSRPPLALLLGAFALYTLRFGLGWGSGDHDELVPSALSLLDPSLFTRDWLIQTVADGVNVRTPFVWLLAGLGGVMPLAWAGALLHAVVWLGTAGGVWTLGRTLTRSRLAAALGTVLALVVTVAFAVGSNALVSNAALPESVAWMLLVPAMALFWERRWLGAGVLIGVAAWFHLLAAGLMGITLGLVMLAEIARRADTRFTDALRLGVPALLLASPMLAPVVLDQAAATADLSGPDPAWIHAVFRNAWHHLPGTFGLGLWAKFSGTMAAGLASLVALRRSGRIRGGGGVLTFWIVSAGFFAVGAVGTAPEIPVSLVAKLQPFKLAVPSVLLATLCLGGWLAARVPPALRDGLRTWAAWRPPVRDALTLAAVGAAFAWGAADGGPFGGRIEPAAHPTTPLGQVEAWARDSTPPDALFAVPPTASTFRSYARRATVITWNGFVFGDAEMQTWYARLRDLAPIEHTRGVDPKPALDAGYAARSAADWRAVRDQYGIDYAVVPSVTTLPFPVAHHADSWTVYALAETPETNSAPPDESSGAQDAEPNMEPNAASAPR